MHINTFVLMKPPYVFQLLFGSDIRLKKINIHLVQKRHWWLKSQKRLCQPPPTKVSDLWAMNPNGFQTTIYIDANNLPALVLNNAIAELSAIIITQYDYPDAEKKTMSQIGKTDDLQSIANLIRFFCVCMIIAFHDGNNQK